MSPSPNKIYLKTHIKPLGGYMEPMRLKIRKTASGTYYIPSLSIKQLRALSKTYKRRWRISKNEQTLILEGE
jgi:chorismate-pyruvate lyase